MIHANITTETERRMAGDAEPEYQCAQEHCDYAAWTPEEMHQCITCKKRFCADCLVAIGGEKFCTEHAKCSCGQPAIEACMECGTVLCDKCLKNVEHVNGCDTVCCEVCA